MIHQGPLDFNGTRIEVKTAGKGKESIIFLHGSSQSADTWLPQLQDNQLTERYHLMAIDLPGHGQSQWLGNGTQGYRPANLVPLVKKLISDFHIERYILAGLSYGTNIIGEITPPWPDCAGIMLISPCIMNESVTAAKILTPGPHGHVIAAADPSDEDLKSFVFHHMKKEEIGLRYISSYRSTDPRFREELAKALLEGELTDELKNINAWKLPVCVVFGKEETLINNSYLDDYLSLWKQQIFLIENAGHLPNEEQPVAFNNLLLSFANEVFR
jgi:pimeloyl-ACP methyl ester carboxylesterase